MQDLIEMLSISDGRVAYDETVKFRLFMPVTLVR